MYWAVRDDGTYEIIEGSTTHDFNRTICDWRFFVSMDCIFSNLPNDKKKQILGYELMIYVCSGTDSEKLEWFRTINIAGEKLTNQELRNAVYAGILGHKSQENF